MVAVTEELQEGQVRKSRVAFLFDRGTPMLHCAKLAALQLKAEATTVEAHLYLTGVPGGNGSRKPPFEHRRHVAEESREIEHPYIEGIMVVAIEPVERRFGYGVVEGMMLAERERQRRELFLV